MSDPIRSISQNNYLLATQQEVSHDNTLSGNGTEQSPLGVDSQYMKLLEVSQPFTTNADNYTASATIPEGYKFLCWVNMRTNGFSQIFYPVQPTTTPGIWWKGGSLNTPSSSSSVTSTYLVIKEN